MGLGLGFALGHACVQLAVGLYREMNTRNVQGSQGFHAVTMNPASRPSWLCKL